MTRLRGKKANRRQRRRGRKLTGDKAEEEESEQVTRLRRKKANRRQRRKGRKLTGDKVEDEEN